MANPPVQGLKELGEAMARLNTDIARKIARQATAAGAGVVRKAARAAAPKDTGALAKGVVIKRVPRSALTSEYVVTISTREMAKYVAKSRSAIYELEGPTRPEMVNGKVYRKKKLMAIRDSYESLGDLYYGRFMEFGTVKMPARPFLGPALENNQQAAVAAMAERLAARLRKVGVL